MRATLLLALGLVACGPKPRPIPDSGPEDAGVDAGVDAGRPRGEDPPTGWTVALPYPADAGTLARWGTGASLALDRYGQPMIAALVIDPNSDGVLTDNRLVFSRWNGVTRAWQVPVTVEVVGDVDVSHPNRPVSLAWNPANGTIGVAYLKDTGEVRYGRSEDEGEHFSLESLPGTGQLSNPVLAYAGDTVHLAHNARHTCPAGTCATVFHGTKMGSGTPFTATEVAGAHDARDWPIAMALSSSGEPGFAFFADDTSGNVTLSYTQAGSTQTIATSDVMVDTMAKIPSVSLTLAGDVPRVAFHLLSSTSPDAQLWYAQKLAGAWSTPVALPRNGPAGMLDSTRWYQGLVSEGGTKVAVVANFAQAGAVGQQCGGPKLYRSADGAAFPMPCHPAEAGGPLVHALNQAGLWVNLAAHRPGKLTIALDYEQRSNPTIGGGVLLYREQ